MITIFLLRRIKLINIQWLRKLVKAILYTIFVLTFIVVFHLIFLHLFNNIVADITGEPAQNVSASDSDNKSTTKALARYDKAHTPAKIKQYSNHSLKKMYAIYPHTTKLSEKYVVTTKKSHKKEILNDALRSKDIKTLVAICYYDPTNINKEYVFSCAWKLDLDKHKEAKKAYLEDKKGSNAYETTIYYDHCADYYAHRLTKSEKGYITPQLRKILHSIYGISDHDDEDYKEAYKEFKEVYDTHHNNFIDTYFGWLANPFKKNWPSLAEIIFLFLDGSGLFMILNEIADPKGLFNSFGS